MSNKKSIIWIAAAAILLMLGCSSYNGMVKLDQTVDQKWADVETAYQARADKVQNLAAIVKNAANYEKETLTAVVEARAKATSVNISADNLTAENLAQFEAAQNQLSGSLSRLLVTLERYPELQAVQAYRDFQAEYAGIENRIRVARMDYNEEVKNFNVKIKRLPNVLYAGALGFHEKPLFKAQEGTEKAPSVDDALN